MDDKQQNFYKRLLINIRVKCLKQGFKKSEFCLKLGTKISNVCLKQGQGTRGRAAPPHPGIYRVPPPGESSRPHLTLEPSQPAKKVQSISQWLSAFNIFVATYAEKQATDTPKLMKYCEIGEHRRSILNHHQLSITTPVSSHFNQAGHSINDVHLIPIELIRSKRDSVRKTREAHLINKAKTLHPFGINRRDETHQ